MCSSGWSRPPDNDPSLATENRASALPARASRWSSRPARSRCSPKLWLTAASCFGLVSWAIAQAVQVAGALLILAAYAAAQFGLLDQSSRRYLVLNLVGSAILAVFAWYEEQLGFLLLEGVWALISAWNLLQLLRGQRPAAPHQ